MAKTAGETMQELLENEVPEGADESSAESEEQKKPRRRRRKEPETPAEEAAEIESEREPEAGDGVDDSSQLDDTDDDDPWQDRLQRAREELQFDDTEDPLDVFDRTLEFAREQQREAEEALRWKRENEPLVSYGREYLQHQREPEQQKQPERKPWQAPKPPEIPKQYIEVGENGEHRLTADTPAALRAQHEEYEAFRTSFAENLVYRPDKVLDMFQQMIDDRFRENVEPFYEERTREQSAQQFFRQFEGENAEWLFTRDPRTNRPTGRLSQSGEFLNERVAAHMQRGYSHEDALRYAMYDYQETTGQTPWQKSEEVNGNNGQSLEETRDQQRKEHSRAPLKGARRKPTRKGSFTEPGDETPQNSNESFGQSILRNRDREGVVATPYEI